MAEPQRFTPFPGLTRRRFSDNDIYATMRSMTTVDDIKDAVSKLQPGELAGFRAWFEAFEEARFDQKIERDAEPESSTSWPSRR